MYQNIIHFIFEVIEHYFISAKNILFWNSENSMEIIDYMLISYCTKLCL